MKPFVTALGICALVLMAGVANATVRTWDGGSADDGDSWTTAANWSNDTVPVCSTPDDAVVQTQGPGWPQLPSDQGVRHHTMRNAADLDVSGYTLFVTGIFTAEDDSGVGGASAVTISNGHDEAGGITAAQIVFNGGTSGMTIALSGNTTVRTCSSVGCTSATCP